MKVDYKVDAKGLACPMPIVKARKAFKEMDAGWVIEIEATDKGSTADLQAWAKSAGHEYIGTIEQDDVLRHYLRKTGDDENEEAKFPNVASNEQLMALLENEEVMVFDVREVSEYAFGHIPGARSVPLDQLESQFNQSAKEQEIYVICRTGNRSDLAAQQLAKAGFEKVFNVVPGMHKWNGSLEKNV